MSSSDPTQIQLETKDGHVFIEPNFDDAVCVTQYVRNAHVLSTYTLAEARAVSAAILSTVTAVENRERERKAQRDAEAGRSLRDARAVCDVMDHVMGAPA